MSGESGYRPNLELDDVVHTLCELAAQTPDDASFNYKEGYLTLFNGMTDFIERAKALQVKAEGIVIGKLDDTFIREGNH